MMVCPVIGNITSYASSCVGYNCEWFVPAVNMCAIQVIACGFIRMTTPPLPIVVNIKQEEDK